MIYLRALRGMIIDTGIGIRIYPAFFRIIWRGIRARSARKIERNLDRLMRVFPPF